VRRPYIIGEGLIPQSQTGLEMYGSYNFEANLIGYHLTLSNVRGPVDTHQDFDTNKALGGRLYLRNDGLLGIITIGASAYHGLYTKRHDAITPAYVTEHVIDEQYKETTVAGDLQWEYEGALLQGEVMVNDIVHDDAHRPIAPWIGGPQGLKADLRKFGVYGLVGYRTPFAGIMPFFGGEYYDQGTVPSYAIWGGISMRPTPRVVLKAQGTHSWHPTWPGTDVDILDLHAAWSF
jgi:hypothetical protein